jgi:putative alpha-1,2-mannosidase
MLSQGHTLPLPCRPWFGWTWTAFSVQTNGAAFQTSVGFKSSLKFTMGLERAHSFSQEPSPLAGSGSVSDVPLSLESEELWKQISQ